MVCMSRCDISLHKEGESIMNELSYVDSSTMSTSFMSVEHDNETMNDTGGTGSSVGSALTWHVLEGIIGCLGVFGNGIVLFVFFRDKSLRSLINSFIINQSLIDFTTSFVFLLINFVPNPPLDPSSLRDRIICQIWLSEYVMWALFISSSLNLVCITLDRYVAIIYPARYRSSASKLRRRVKLIAVLMWSSGFTLDCYWAAIQIVIPPGICVPSWPNEIMQGIIGFVIFFITYAGPLGVMGFSYARIISKLCKQSTRTTAPSPKPSPSSAAVFKAIRRSKRTMSERSAKATRNVIKTMLTVSLTYAICWAPIAFNFLVYNLGGPLDFAGIWYKVTKLFVYANMCANPFIYTMQYQQFQRGFERAFKVNLFGGLPDSSDPTKTQNTGGESSQDGLADVPI